MSRILKHVFTLLPSMIMKNPETMPSIQQVVFDATTTPDSTVILGGGIIGLSTAYYLSEETGSSIVVVDPASTVCAGASGQCEGVLGDFGVRSELSTLNQFSYKLHVQLSEKYDGSKQYGYCPLKIHTVFSDGYDPNNPKLPFPVQRPESRSQLPAWFKSPKEWEAGLIATGSVAARVNPLQFCSLLHRECESRGVKFLLNSTAVSIDTHASSTKPNTIKVVNHSSNESRDIQWNNLILSAGSWSGRLFSTLFPHAQSPLPFKEQQPAQDWIHVDFKGSKSQCSGVDSCEQVWLDPALKNMALHISSSPNGGWYAASDFIDIDHLPDSPEGLSTPDDIEMRIVNSTRDHLQSEDAQDIEIVGKGRALMPRTQSEIPIISKAPWNYLFPDGSMDELQKDREMFRSGGVFVNTGHYLDGFALGPGSGKLLAELVNGKEPSIDISPFGLPQSEK